MTKDSEYKFKGLYRTFRLRSRRLSDIGRAVLLAFPYSYTARPKLLKRLHATQATELLPQTTNLCNELDR